MHGGRSRCVEVAVARHALGLAVEAAGSASTETRTWRSGAEVDVSLFGHSRAVCHSDRGSKVPFGPGRSASIPRRVIPPADLDACSYILRLRTMFALARAPQNAQRAQCPRRSRTLILDALMKPSGHIGFTRAGLGYTRHSRVDPPRADAGSGVHSTFHPAAAVYSGSLVIATRRADKEAPPYKRAIRRSFRPSQLVTAPQTTCRSLPSISSRTSPSPCRACARRTRPARVALGPAPSGPRAHSSRCR